MCLGRQRWRNILHGLLTGACGIAAAAGRTLPAQAQRGATWNSAQARALVAAAIANRGEQLGDRGLTDYRALAHGYLTFLAQVGPGFPDPPKVVRSDELALEVYWRAPNLSLQRIIGRRDTLLLPADIGYYRDRYGIIQNNFPDSIRLGEGNDVRGVPHPLSPRGPDDYDYAVSDSLEIKLPDRMVSVFAVLVRPRDPQAPRVVGTVFLEQGTGALVRMTATFTRAAILDRRIETLEVTLDNALVEGRFWLPHRQQLEVVRSATWFDYPVRGIIRGRWQVCCYELNRGLERGLFGGPEIVSAAPAVVATYPWRGRVLDSLPPDVAAASVADVEKALHTAREVVRRGALARVRTTAVVGHGASDFVRVNRVEGLAVGVGAVRYLGPAWAISGRARYGLDDHRLKGEGRLTWISSGAVALAAFAFRDYRDAGDVAEGSMLAMSIAAQEFGADHTDPYDVRGLGVRLDAGVGAGFRWSVSASREEQRSLSIHATPANGRFGPTIPALALQASRVCVGLDRLPSRGPAGTTWRAHAELRGETFAAADTASERGGQTVGRAFLDVETSRQFDHDRLVIRAMAGAATASAVLPSQERVFVGGPVTGPGYAYHGFTGRSAGGVRVEWQAPVPGPAISLGRFGTTRSRMTIAPFAVVVWESPAAGRHRAGLEAHPAIGVGGIGLFDLVRVDVARGLGGGGRWTVWVDATRDWWGIL